MTRLLCLAYLLLPCVAFGYEPERARANLASESAECAAYFLYVSLAPGLNAETKKQLGDTSRSLVLLSGKLSTEKLAFARVDLATKTMVREMEGDWGNVAILNNKYGYPCKDLVANPEARMRYWLEKRD